MPQYAARNKAFVGGADKSFGQEQRSGLCTQREFVAALAAVGATPTQQVTDQ